MHRPGVAKNAFLLGLPFGIGILCLINLGPLKNTTAHRYLSHPVECVEVLMFCVAIGALAGKLTRSFLERRVCRTNILPAWDGKAVPVSQAAELLRELDKLPRRLHTTWLARRAAAVLHFLESRGSANELDDHLRALADNDSLALESSYSLTRFITWAIPILGFLGTVLGITGAISGVTPEVLEKSLGTVTDGLALAFDATALALGLTMLVMFVSFLVERGEQAVLEQVDQFADRELAHRFERIAPEERRSLDMTSHHTEILVQAVERMAQRQTTMWQEALAKADARRVKAEQTQEEWFTSALQNALKRTLDAHAASLSSLETQVVERCKGLLGQLASLSEAVQRAGRNQEGALSEVCRKLSAQIDSISRLGTDSRELRSLQESLNQNLSMLIQAGKFEEAMHSLTAAIHLLTARAVPVAAGTRNTNRMETAA
jgi:biopolymer transport protein ExbB/TolQ